MNKIINNEERTEFIGLIVSQPQKTNTQKLETNTEQISLLANCD